MSSKLFERGDCSPAQTVVTRECMSKQVLISGLVLLASSENTNYIFLTKGEKVFPWAWQPIDNIILGSISGPSSITLVVTLISIPLQQGGNIHMQFCVVICGLFNCVASNW